MASSGNVNWMGIIGLIGAVLMIAGVFLTWAEMNISILGFSSSVTMSGMDVFNGTVTIEGQEFSDVEFDYAYAPIVCLVAGVLSLITTIIPIVYNKIPTINRILGAVSLILAIVALVLAIMFNGQMDAVDFEGLASASVSAGTGVWVCVAGGVLLAIGAIVDIAKKYVTSGDN